MMVVYVLTGRACMCQLSRMAGGGMNVEFSTGIVKFSGVMTFLHSWLIISSDIFIDMFPDISTARD